MADAPSSPSAQSTLAGELGPGGGAAPSSAGGPSSPSFSPLYQQIKALLVRSLQQGEWRAGDVIPSEVELAARFKVSQGTVRKAIDEMAADKLLVRRQGKGTFVATHDEEATRYRFLRLFPDATGAADAPDAPSAPDGPGAAPLRRELLDCRRMRSSASTASLLAMPAGEPAVEIRRLLLDGNSPIVLDHLWLPGALFEGLTAESLESWRGPLYRQFEVQFAVRMIRAEEKIKAVLADADSAAALQVPLGTPLLQVQRLSFTYGNKPVELRRGLYRTEAYHYRNELS